MPAVPSLPALRRTLAMSATAALLATGAALALPTSASAADGTVGVRETVCAQDLYVRTAPVGAWTGTLYQGQTFLVEELDGSWVYGFAYGDINRHGWVQNGWFC